MTARPTKAVLYDFDGTLVNSLGVIVAATNAVLAEHGAGSRPGPEIIAGMVHPTGRRMGGLLGIDDPSRQVQLAAAFYAAAYRVGNDHAFAYEGVAAALAGFAAERRPQGVVSNNHGRLVRQLLERLGLAPHVAVAFGEEDVPAIKPDPRGLLLAAERLGVAPGSCVYVGDTPGDLHAARAAGMPCIGVSWGIMPRSVLEPEGFAAVIDHPAELAMALAGIA